ncbi:hypothetical protein HED22_15160 [Thalassospira sp. HF15]|uniref:hypothetical protein n=1 Tax=Thalassospira sp. HF15 TaxID=2722755 RepID=UPI001430ABCA|nr:hypothetical protein [Thalassospira sp. HF15]NIY76992.1 hypothetical protein [Thalassospira sp. HF15]
MFGVSSEEVYFNESIFFQIGLPELAPPRIRGSMMVVINKEFLTRNSEGFLWGSAFDTGACQAGYLGSDLVKYAEKLRFSFGEMLSIVSRINEKCGGGDGKSFSQLNYSEVSEVLEEVFPENFIKKLIQVRGNSPLFFELCFNSKAKVRQSDIIALYCPNNYVREIRKYLSRGNEKIKFVGYNPRFGLESLALDEDILSRNI